MKPKLFLLFSISCLFLSCVDDCVNGSKDVATENIAVPAFSEILNSTLIDIELEDGPNTSVTLTAEDNLFDVFTFNVLAATLELGSSGQCISTNERAVANITTNQLELIAVAGSGNIAGTANFQNANILSGGSGDIVLRGADAGNLSIALNGTGDINIGEILANNLTIESNGTGDMFVHTNGTLEVIMNGTGNVYYKGSPTIIESINGTGQLIDNN